MDVDAIDLRNWADQNAADGEFPQLIRRLVLATVRANKVSFRSAEGVRLGGWDGVVEGAEENPWVPDGRSGWELSVQRDPRQKAEADYAKRTEDPLGLERATTTFVFATPRAWGNKEAWEQAKRAEGSWRGVKVLDADDLLIWLEQAPAVELWLRRLLGKASAEGQDLESYWDEWSGATQPALSVQILTAGRDQAVQAVHRWLAQPASTLRLRGETEDEAIAFLFAALGRAPEDEARDLLPRAIVVEDPRLWRRLVATRQPHVLIAAFAGRANAPAAANRGHHVLIPLGRDAPPARDEIVLPRLTRDQARAALRAMGISERRAGELADRAHRGLPLLRRELGAIAPPSWPRPDQARALIPAVLAGRWRDDSPADREVMERLAGRRYAEVSDSLLRWSNEPDPPIRRIGDTWVVTSREDSWSQLARFVARDDLERLEEAVIRVLGEVDPKYHLPDARRWAAALDGALPHHSEPLRRGLSETLALLGATSELYELGDHRTGQEWACRIIRRLLRAAGTWTHWASLGDNLRYLAEGCPEEFLTAVERDLGREDPVVAQLFSDGGWFGSSPHTGLIRALECVAWSPIHLPRVALALARLAKLDPGGRVGPRPLGALREIFLLWRPCTSASQAERLQIIDLLRQREPQYAWELMLALIPETHDVASPTAEPRWRDWAPDDGPVVTRQELAKGIAALTTRLLADVRSDARRWASLIARLEDLPRAQFVQVVDAVADIDPTSLTDEERNEIARSLRKLISRHAEFPNAVWALPLQDLDRLRHVYAQLEPQGIVNRYASLFSDRPELLDPTPGGWQERERVAATRRVEAVTEVYRAGGLPAVLELAEGAQRPWTVGVALAHSDVGLADVEILAPTLGGRSPYLREMALGFVHARSLARGQRWVRELLDDPGTADWSPTLRGRTFLYLPFGPATWDLLGAQDQETQDAYWREVSIRDLGELQPDVIERAVAELQARGRHETAVQLVALYGREVRAELIADALEQLAAHGPGDDVTWPSIVYDVDDLLRRLQPSEGVPLGRVARLEWMYLHLLFDDTAPRGERLQRALASDPALFVQVLRLVYGPETPEEGKDGAAGSADGSPTPGAGEDDERRRLAVRRGLDLLHAWRVPPGLTEEGRVGGDALREWVREARRLAAEAGRGRVADRHIGRVLVHLPEGADGIRPPEAVRDLLEEVEGEEIEEGFHLGVVNSRGVTSRGLTEGGRQERELAAKCRTEADAVARWPRTARLLRRLADWYEAMARDEDVAADLLDEELWG